MSPNVNSSYFKNSSNLNQKKKNPLVPLILIVLLAIAAIAVQYWVLDVNQAMREEIQQQQTIAETKK